MLGVEDVSGLFDYKDGLLVRKVTVRYNARKGDVVGSLTNGGYAEVMVKGFKYRVHQLVFILHHGYLPKAIDHIDGDKLNNRIENLRACTGSQNQHNCKINKNNTSGYKGVSWNKKTRMWQAIICVDKRQKNIGAFWDAWTASLALSAERAKIHGKYANNG